MLRMIWKVFRIQSYLTAAVFENTRQEIWKLKYLFFSCSKSKVKMNLEISKRQLNLHYFVVLIILYKDRGFSNH